MRDDASLIEQLSSRQREVLHLMGHGQSNKEIAGALGISPETARTHATAVLAKLGVSNRTEAATTYVRWAARPEYVAAVLVRPAIAVLPLVVASTGPGLPSGPNDEVLAVGVARELVTLLSRWSWFPVISHAATRDPRSLGDTSQQIGRQLGARFLVDGLLHRTRGSWRLAVNVVDADNGQCVWSERYDIPARRWFAMQDEVCTAIVAAAYPRLIATVHAGLPPTPEADPAAWQLAHRALLLHEARERTSNRRAEEGFAQSVARDPRLVLAHFGRGLVAYDAVVNQWDQPRGALDLLGRCADRCLDLAPRHPEGHLLSARRLQASGEHAQAQPALRLAIGLNPSFAPAYAVLAQTLLLTGEHQEGITWMQQACRLDPRSFVAGLAVAHFVRAEYAAATLAVERAIANNPRYPFAYALAAACAWWQDDHERALAHAESLAALTDFAPAVFARTFGDQIDGVTRLRHALEQLRQRRARTARSPMRGATPRASASSGSTGAAAGSRPTAP